MLFCLELYLLLPFMRRYIRRASLAAHVAVTAAMVGAATTLLLPLSPALTALFCGLVLFTSLGCPAWLLGIQKFKAKINGPWDEAVPCLPGTIQWRGAAAGSAPPPPPPQQHAQQGSSQEVQEARLQQQRAAGIPQQQQDRKQQELSLRQGNDTGAEDLVVEWGTSGLQETAVRKSSATEAAMASSSEAAASCQVLRRSSRRPTRRV